MLSGVAAAEAAAASAEAAAASAQEAATVAFEELEEVWQYADSHEGCDFDFKVSDAVAMEHATLDAAAAMHQPLLKPKARAHHSWVQQAHDGAPKRQRVSGIPTSLFHASVRVSELQMLKVVHVGKTKLLGAFVMHHRKLFTKGGWAIARVSLDVGRQCSAKKGLLCCSNCCRPS